MYPSSSSSSSQHSTGGAASNLLRYGSAPSSLLSAAVDSVIGTGTRVPTMSQCFSVHDSANRNNSSRTTISGCNLQRSYALSSEISAVACGRGYTTAGSNFSSAAAAPAAVSSCTTSAASPPSNLVRHSSSPAGFFNCLASDIGSSVSKGIESYEAQGGVCTKPSRLPSAQLSFASRECLSQISLVNECVIDGSFTSEKGHKRRSHSQSATSFSISPWDDGNSIVFSAPPSKRPSNNNDSILDDISAMESQFSLPEAAFDMINVENLLQTPRESVPCKIRAKRGCATHPRSIAERERRTRISGKLKKLQELVPNMDKAMSVSSGVKLSIFDQPSVFHNVENVCTEGYMETSYADMLDLAAQHIKGLQSQIELQLGKDESTGSFPLEATPVTLSSL